MPGDRKTRAKDFCDELVRKTAQARTQAMRDAARVTDPVVDYEARRLCGYCGPPHIPLRGKK